MGYNTAMQLQLFCIFLAPATGIETVVVTTTLTREGYWDFLSISSLVLIFGLFGLLSMGYHITTHRSVTLAKWFYQGLIALEVLEFIELIVVISFRYSTGLRSIHPATGYLVIWNLVDLIIAMGGAYLGWRYYKYLDSGVVLLSGDKALSEHLVLHAKMDGEIAVDVAPH
eukprot:Hpha_TRINITY_DN16059_c0_g1::TRINITY_DN16059_c0_g1_i1::g.117189::m.117189